MPKCWISELSPITRHLPERRVTCPCNLFANFGSSFRYYSTRCALVCMTAILDTAFNEFGPGLSGLPFVTVRGTLSVFHSFCWAGLNGGASLMEKPHESSNCL
ncbi:unnamed protein product [Protopolystoma xenopodis]|uniref:Uncharacterized protein n=1 Tax=Protopolystoma xenopodis TaxID=117903 RepID=A0A3S5CRS3_9PLAT|nr:unnamed protein product [Protopolystoma xenopodis]